MTDLVLSSPPLLQPQQAVSTVIQSDTVLHFFIALEITGADGLVVVVVVVVVVVEELALGVPEELIVQMLWIHFAVLTGGTGSGQVTAGQLI